MLFLKDTMIVKNIGIHMVFTIILIIANIITKISLTKSLAIVFLYKKVAKEDIENITSYFMNFEHWMEIDERIDVYDFDIDIIGFNSLS